MCIRDRLYHAKLANLDAAIMCNHKRTIPKTFEDALQKKRETLKNAEKASPWTKQEDSLKKAENKTLKTEKQKEAQKKQIKKIKLQIKKKKDKQEERVEKLKLQIDLTQKTCSVVGKGSITIINSKCTTTFQTGGNFSTDILGDVYFPEQGEGIDSDVWEKVVTHHRKIRENQPLPDNVINLIKERSEARDRKDWNQSDLLREQLVDQGYSVKDTSDGPKISPIR